MREQHEAARPRDAQLREFERRLAAADGHDVHERRRGDLEVNLGPVFANHSLPGAGVAFNAINYTNKNSDPSNATAVATQLKVFLCPSEVNPQAF